MANVVFALKRIEKKQKILQNIPYVCPKTSELSDHIFLITKKMGFYSPLQNLVSYVPYYTIRNRKLVLFPIAA
jgi:hypothetical protein